MGATATLNIRLPEDLKERGMEVLSRQHMSVSDAVRQLFHELERSQQVPEFLQKDSASESIQSKRQLLRDMTHMERKSLSDLEPPVDSASHNWHNDWHQHLLEKYASVE